MTLEVIEGDCLAVLPTLATRFHAVVTDPPYHLIPGGLSLNNMAHKVGQIPGGLSLNNMAHKVGQPNRIANPSGFMGAKWDGGDVAFRPETWRAVFDVMLPGGYLVAFASTRGYHRMVCAIEDAGFVIHPMLAWIFGSGFPKAADVSKAIDRQLGAVREVVGRGNRCIGPSQAGANGIGTFKETNWQDSNLITAPATPEAQQWDGWKYGLQSLKPAIEPICLAQRPPECGGMVGNILRHGTGALNIDASRIPTQDALGGGRISTTTDGWDRPWKHDEASRAACFERGDAAVAKAETLGRYPANVIHDGSPEVLDAFAAFGDKSSTRANGNPNDPIHGSNGSGTSYEWGEVGRTSIDHRDTGTAARFFYSAKADAADRADSRHPTVKPVDLIRYLVRLVTPPGGRVLDPFAGSGTTGEACMLLGHDCTLIERDATHAADIRHRIKRWSGLDAPLFADAAN